MSVLAVSGGAPLLAPRPVEAQVATATPLPVQLVQIGGYDAGQVVDVFRIAVVVGFAMALSLLAAIAIRGVRSR